MAVGSPSLWQRLCDTFDLDSQDPRFATNDDRVRNRRELVDMLESTFATTSTERLLGELAKAGVPAGKVRSLDEVYDWDQVASQGLKISVEHPRLGPVTLPGPPLRFFDPQEREITKAAHATPPVLDGHGTSVRRWLTEVDARPGSTH
jgi:crotonobetainyl-CoA:carnitine CoA-transferase CaiB-like acyl-CoA transferase